MKILMFAILLTVATLVPLYGVMFASDEVTLTEDGMPITDNSVLMIDTRDPNLRVVVEQGMFTSNQNPAPQIFKLMRMKGPVTTWEEWQKSGKDEQAYDAYLDGLIPLYTVTIELPVATDRSTSYSPPPGETGGVIGTARFFSVDLKTGKVSLSGQSFSQVRTYP